MSKLTERVANYCKKLSGQDLPLKALDKQRLSKLPLTITGSYHCYEAVLMGIPVILLEVLHDDYTPKQLQKHQMIVMRLTNCQTVYAVDNVVSYHMSRMIEYAVNFIIPDKIIYVPTLLIILKEMKDCRSLENEIIPGVAQCILLFHMQLGNLNCCTTRALAEKFNMSYASMNRALRWLNIKGLIDLEGDKEKTLKIADKGKDLWEKAMPLMVSPIERVMYTNEQLTNWPYAGESALEGLTMLSAPEVPCRAVSKDWACEQKATLNKIYGECKIEVWRYDPMLLTKNNSVDPLSLYLSLKNNEDERVRIELKYLMDHIKWLKD